MLRMNGTDDLNTRVRTEYHEHAQDVLDLLASYGSAEHEREELRVRSAILDLAKGDLRQVADLVAAAKRDYRDILYWHQRI
jgi:hypothetical protein